MGQRENHKCLWTIEDICLQKVHISSDVGSLTPEFIVHEQRHLVIVCLPQMATIEIFPDSQIKRFCRPKVYLIRSNATSPFDGYV